MLQDQITDPVPGLKSGTCLEPVIVDIEKMNRKHQDGHEIFAVLLSLVNNQTPHL